MEDAGNYCLEVFYENGTLLMKREFELRVEAAGNRTNTLQTSKNAVINTVYTTFALRTL